MSGDSQEKTEQPTHKKLEDARKKGQVWQSKDFSTMLIITIAFVYFWLGWDMHMERLRAIMLMPTYYMTQPFEDIVYKVVISSMSLGWDIIAPLLVLVFVTGLVGNFLLVGPVFSAEPLSPKFEKLNPASGLKKIFSMKGFIDVIKSILMMFIFIGIYYIVFFFQTPYYGAVSHCGFSCFQKMFSDAIFWAILMCIIVLIIVSFIDVIIQKELYIKDQKMSKDEVKREFKQREGSPEIKAKRREIGNEYMAGTIVRDVAKASIVVTDGNKLAVALFYDKDVAPLPYLVSKGAKSSVSSLLENARRGKVPIKNDKKVARLLFDRLDAGSFLEEDMIEPVANFMVSAGIT